MDTKSERAAPPVISQATETEAWTEELDDMDEELGLWLAHTAARLGVRTGRAGTVTSRSVKASLWRTLILIWATSPTARLMYSADARGGLLSATRAMDDCTLRALVAGLLSETGPIADDAANAA